MADKRYYGRIQWAFEEHRKMVYYLRCINLPKDEEPKFSLINCHMDVDEAAVNRYCEHFLKYGMVEQFILPDVKSPCGTSDERPS